MNIVFLGPQGSGKGTQARILADKYGFFYFESGVYLRKIAENNSELKKSLDAGELVPDREMTSYLTAYLDQQNLYDDIIFDGFPRTLNQYNFLKNWLSEKKVGLDLTVVLEISSQESIKRLSARRQDPKTGQIFNLITEPPPAGIDPDSLIQRDDDKLEAIKRRLSIYESETKPLILELAKNSKVVKIDGERPVGRIAEEISALVENFKNGN